MMQNFRNIRSVQKCAQITGSNVLKQPFTRSFESELGIISAPILNKHFNRLQKRVASYLIVYIDA